MSTTPLKIKKVLSQGLVVHKTDYRNGAWKQVKPEVVALEKQCLWNRVRYLKNEWCPPGDMAEKGNK